MTLPALTGPYQDVRAVLSYGGDVRLPDGCKAIAVSHGMNDDGQFRLDFNDGHWLPFEGIPVDNDSSLFLSFPEATKDEQKALLLSLERYHHPYPLHHPLIFILTGQPAGCPFLETHYATIR